MSIKITRQFLSKFTIGGVPYNFTVEADNDEDAKQKLREILTEIIEQTHQ